MERFDPMNMQTSEQPAHSIQKIDQEIEALKKQIKELENNSSYSVRVDKVGVDGEHKTFSSKDSKEQELKSLEKQIKELEIQKNVLEIENSNQELILEQSIEHTEDEVAPQGVEDTGVTDVIADEVVDENIQSELESEVIEENQAEESLQESIVPVEEKRTFSPVEVPPMPVPDFETQSYDPVVLALQKSEQALLNYDQKYKELVRIKRQKPVVRFFTKILRSIKGQESLPELEQKTEEARQAYETAQGEYLKLSQQDNSL